MTKLLLSLALMSAIANACAEERALLSYNELVDHTFIGKFQAVAPARRDKLKLRGLIVPKNKRIHPYDVVLTIASKDGRTILPIDAEGTFDLPLKSQWITENPMVMTSLPENEKSAIGFNAYVVLPAQQKIGYATLMGGVDQANLLVRELAGVFRLLAPTFDGVVVHFGKPSQQTVQVMTAAGPRVLTADSKGTITILKDVDLQKEDTPVVFSELPAFVGLDAK